MARIVTEANPSRPFIVGRGVQSCQRPGACHARSNLSLVQKLRSQNSPLIDDNAILNTGKLRIWGIEVDASATFFDRLKADLGYSYLNTKVIDIARPVLAPELAPYYSAINPTTFAGDPLALSRENRLSLTGTFTLPIDERIGRVTVGATYVYTDDYVLSRSTATQFQVAPASNLLNLNATWSNVMVRPIDLSFFMTNVTDEEMRLSVNNVWSSFGME